MTKASSVSATLPGHDDSVRKLRSLQRPSQYLKPKASFKKLDAFASEMTDNEAAENLNSARDKLFKLFHERLKLSS